MSLVISTQRNSAFICEALVKQISSLNTVTQESDALTEYEMCYQTTSFNQTIKPKIECVTLSDLEQNTNTLILNTPFITIWFPKTFGNCKLHSLRSTNVNLTLFEAEMP